MDKFNDIDIKAISMFNDGSSLTKIAKELSVDRYCLGQRLKKKFGIDPSLKQNNKRYKVDSNFFDFMNTENKFYWLGFIFADGHMRTQSNSLEIGLSIKDQNHLNKFLNDLNSDYPIRTKRCKIGLKVYDSCNISICDKALYNSLIKLGCTNNKTYNLTFPSITDKSMLAHFIRGFFDGDGGIAVAKDTDRITRLTVTAYSEQILEEFANLIRIILPDFQYSIRRKKGTNSVSLYVEKIEYVLKLLDIMYQNCTIYLDRKKDLYIKNAAYRRNSTRKLRAKSVEVPSAEHNTEVS